MAKTRSHSGARQGGHAPTQRQLRVAEVIRRTLAGIFTRGDVHDDDLSHVSITVSEVRCSPDLRHATAFVLPLGGVNTEGVLAALRRNRGEIRHLVAGQIELKYAPELTFEADTSFDRMDRTREILNSPDVRRDLD
jgi:ribosome-binding factor A